MHFLVLSLTCRAYFVLLVTVKRNIKFTGYANFSAIWGNFAKLLFKTVTAVTSESNEQFSLKETFSAIVE